MKLSVLDQSPVAHGQSKAEALRETLTLARIAEASGYHRFWVAEHHDSPSFAGTTPALLTLAVLDATSRITVGSGGVMLGLHEPSEVAETFEILAALHPGRINLGVGRAGSGGTGVFNDKLIDLHTRLGLLPDAPGRHDLDIWLLGAGTSSAPLASMFGAGYAHAHFLNCGSGKTALDQYRPHFQPSARRDRPEALAAVRVIAAETESRAQRLAEPVRLWRARKDLADDRPFPGYDEAAQWSWSREESQRRDANEERLIVGSATDVADRLIRLAGDLGVDELMITTPLPQLDDRILSHALLADAVAAQTPKVMDDGRPSVLATSAGRSSAEGTGNASSHHSHP
jgi:alkanesulfonate monooxygenase SsuD/methylene tetrahydromethanopterin reductase-like flavin-dependent oxidoreductase (luciferase family)